MRAAMKRPVNEGRDIDGYDWGLAQRAASTRLQAAIASSFGCLELVRLVLLMVQYPSEFQPPRRRPSAEKTAPFPDSYSMIFILYLHH